MLKNNIIILIVILRNNSGLSRLVVEHCHEEIFNEQYL